MADITRGQFDPSKGVSKKIFQKGRHLVDADLNEQIDIQQYLDRKLLSSLANGDDKRFGEGFRVATSASPLTVIIKAGIGIFHLSSDQAISLELLNDYTLSGFSTWTQMRTDYVYIDILEEEITPAEDPQLVNPAVGEETCRDMRVSFEVKISKGSTPSGPPSGHVYCTIATITKNIGDYILTGDILELLVNYYITLPVSPEIPIWTHTSESHTSANAPELTDSSEAYIVTSSSGETGKRVIKLTYVHQAGVKYLAIYAEVYRDGISIAAHLRLDCFNDTGSQIFVRDTLTPIVAFCGTPINAVVGQMYELSIYLDITGTNVDVHMQKPYIVMGFGEYEVISYSDPQFD